MAVGTPQFLDYGSAPTAAQTGFANSYPTLLADDGARHALGGPRLGSYVDRDRDGLPSKPTANGDADNYGVRFPFPLRGDAANSVIVNLQNANNAKLDAWIDWNQDGDWNDAGEQLFASQTLVTGDNSLPITVPASAFGGLTFARFRVSSAGGLGPAGLAQDGEVEDYQVRIKPLRTRTAPDDLLIYYGFPSLINEANGDVAAAAAEFAKYDVVVLGNGELESQPDSNNTAAIMQSAATVRTQFFGYVELSPMYISDGDVSDRIVNWFNAGADGIFLNDVGYDFGVAREHQNFAIDRAHELGMAVIANGFRVDDVLSSAVDETFNPSGEPTHLTPTDYYLFEGYQIKNGQSVSRETWRTKADALEAYRQSLGIQVLAVTTNGAVDTFHQSQFDYAWYSALLDGYEGFGWGELEFGSVFSSAPLRPRPSVDPGSSFLSGVTAKGNAFRRTTNTGTVEIDPIEPRASFGILYADIAMNSVTANGKNTLIVNYTIENSAVTGPVTLRFVRSADATFSVGDTTLSTVTISNAADLTVGSHTKTFTIGTATGQVKLPGAGATEPATDYFILAVADPANAIAEFDSDPLNEDNTVAFVGAYSTTSTILIHGGPMNDGVTINYPASSSGQIVVQLAGSLLADYSYRFRSTSQFRVRTHQGEDGVVMINDSNLSARPLFAHGGDDNDLLIGAAGADTLLGGAGFNDHLIGKLGNDTLDGGADGGIVSETGNVNFKLTNTTLTGVGSDKLVNLHTANLTGGTGSNTFDVSGWTGSGTLVGFGGSGIDTIVATKNASMVLDSSILRSSDGMSVALSGSFARAKLSGGASDNSFTIGDFGDVTVSGGSGIDVLIVSRDSDMTLSNSSLTSPGFGTLTLSSLESAELTGGFANNILRANGFTAGAVTLVGNGGDDVLIGGSKNDVLRGGAGRDILIGGTGADSLYGDFGEDVLIGGLGADTLVGGSEDDVLIGGSQDDLLYGESGRDILIGGLGADRLAGGSEDDILIGGTCTLSGTISALNAIRNEWTSGNSYAVRVANLTNGGGVNGATKLNSSTVKSDSAADRLAGNAKLDWFFQSASDVLVDFNAGLGEIKTSI